jgi:hypothetical protein
MLVDFGLIDAENGDNTPPQVLQSVIRKNSFGP